MNTNVIMEWENENGEDFFFEGPVNGENQKKATIYAILNSTMISDVLIKKFATSDVNHSEIKDMLSHEGFMIFLVEALYGNKYHVVESYDLPIIVELHKHYNDFYNQNPEMLEE